jgi:hypothetical protein
MVDILQVPGVMNEIESKVEIFDLEAAVIWTEINGFESEKKKKKKKSLIKTVFILYKVHLKALHFLYPYVGT